MFHWEIEKDVNLLKKEGKFDDALKLLISSIDFLEKESEKTHRRLYPSAYEDAAVIFRKLKRYEDEIDILERFLINPKATSETRYVKIAERLEKACLLAGKAEKRMSDGVEKVYYIPENIVFEDRHSFISDGMVVDVETTGFDANKDEMLEIGIVLFSYNWFKGHSTGIKETYVGLREPAVQIPHDATRVHGLTVNDVKGKTFDNAVIQRLFNSARFFIAHNVHFDRRFIKKMYPEVENKDWYCSMNGIKWKDYGHKSKGLQNLIADYRIETENSHRGLDDSMAVYYLLQQVNKTSQSTYFSELLNGSPVNSDDIERTSYVSTYIINAKIEPQKSKKSFWDGLFGK